MTDRAPRLMSCGCVVPYGERCQHYREQRAIADARRPNARARGYDTKWHKASADFLKLPGNERCACGCWRAADMVDHRIAPKGNMKLFWDRTNWQPYALICNTRKAIKHEGGFGRSPMAPSETLATPPRNRPGFAARDIRAKYFPGFGAKTDRAEVLLMPVVKFVPKSRPKPTKSAPKWLRKEARTEWQRLLALLEKKGTLTPENEPMLADYCGARSLIAECDRELSRAKRLTITGADGTVRPHPLIAARNRASQNAISLAKKLGILGSATEKPKGGDGSADTYASLGI